jgi:hypothetical protein
MPSAVLVFSDERRVWRYLKPGVPAPSFKGLPPCYGADPRCEFEVTFLLGQTWHQLSSRRLAKG